MTLWHLMGKCFLRYPQGKMLPKIFWQKHFSSDILERKCSPRYPGRRMDEVNISVAVEILQYFLSAEYFIRLFMAKLLPFC